MDLHSASEDDEQDVIDDSDEDKDEHIHVDEPVVSRTLLTFATRPHDETPVAPMVVVDNSETESESDVRAVKRKSLSPPRALTPSKRVKIEVEGASFCYGRPTSTGPTTLLDDSETESDSDVEPIQATPHNVGTSYARDS